MKKETQSRGATSALAANEAVAIVTWCDSLQRESGGPHLPRRKVISDASIISLIHRICLKSIEANTRRDDYKEFFKLLPWAAGLFGRLPFIRFVVGAPAWRAGARSAPGIRTLRSHSRRRSTALPGHLPCCVRYVYTSEIDAFTSDNEQGWKTQ